MRGCPFLFPPFPFLPLSPLFPKRRNPMRNSNHVPFTAILLWALLAFSAKAQTAQELNSQAQWMTAWVAWMNATGHNNIQVQMVEAQAKLITAQATAITATAGANKTNAEALQALEQARSLALGNNQKRTEVFYTKKTLHDNYKNLTQTPRPTQEDLLRYNQYSQASAPRRLTKEEFNQLRGKISWPALLKREEFSEEREQLDALFTKRLDRNQDISQEVQDLTEKMEINLRSLVRDVPSWQYVEAKKFVRNLGHESQFDFQLASPVGKIAKAN